MRRLRLRRARDQGSDFDERSGRPADFGTRLRRLALRLMILLALATAGALAGSQWFAPSAGRGRPASVERIPAASLTAVRTRLVAATAGPTGPAGGPVFAASSDPGVRALTRLLTGAGPRFARDYRRVDTALSAPTQAKLLSELAVAVGRLLGHEQKLRAKVSRVKVSSSKGRKAKRLAKRALRLVISGEKKLLSSLANFDSPESAQSLKVAQSLLRASGPPARKTMKLLRCVKRCYAGL
jgi:hypothetical protein